MPPPFPVPPLVSMETPAVLICNVATRASAPHMYQPPASTSPLHPPGSQLLPEVAGIPQRVALLCQVPQHPPQSTTSLRHRGLRTELGRKHRGCQATLGHGAPLSPHTLPAGLMLPPLAWDTVTSSQTQLPPGAHARSPLAELTGDEGMPCHPRAPGPLPAQTQSGHKADAVE